MVSGPGALARYRRNGQLTGPLARLLIAGTVAYARDREDSARKFASAGLLMIVALFLGGFMTIGGEWFAMWQSKDWNGIPAALRMVTIAGFALILVHLSPRRATQ